MSIYLVYRIAIDIFFVWFTCWTTNRSVSTIWSTSRIVSISTRWSCSRVWVYRINLRKEEIDRERERVSRLTNKCRMKKMKIMMKKTKCFLFPPSAFILHFRHSNTISISWYRSDISSNQSMKLISKRLMWMTLSLRWYKIDEFAFQYVAFDLIIRFPLSLFLSRFL